MMNPAVIERDHPEGTCQECGGPNVSWWAESELFNSVADRAEVLCPLCFAGRIKARRPDLMASIQLTTSHRDYSPVVDDLMEVSARLIGVEAERDAGLAELEQLRLQADALREAVERKDGALRQAQDAVQRLRAEVERRKDPKPGWDGERCQDCGRGYAVVWAAENDLWNEVMGGYKGMLCPDCFDRRCEPLGISPFFVAHREHVNLNVTAEKVERLEARVAQLESLDVDTLLDALGRVTDDWMRETRAALGEEA